MTIKGLVAVLAVLAFTSPALAVSIGEMARDCGDDAERYCQGVGYGEAMQQCLDRNAEKLTPQCKAIVDRLNQGEGVSLF